MPEGDDCEVILRPQVDEEALEIAEWMASEFRRNGQLTQRTAVVQISKIFGERFVYLNNNGNKAIQKAVLAAFRDLTESEAVWVKDEFRWRRRRPNDPPFARKA